MTTTTTANKELIKKVNDAFTEGNVEAFLDYCAEDVRWIMGGESSLIGKEQLRKAMTSAPEQEPPQITVRNIIEEGDMVVCDGTMKMKKLDGTMLDGMFCDVYRIQDGKIVELTSYVVENKPTHN